jgi:hypothetical protein
MIEDFQKVASIRMPIQQVMALNLGTIIILKGKQVTFTKRIIKTHLGIYVHAIIPDELLNECNMINRDIKYQIEDIRQMNSRDIMYIDIYGKITAIRGKPLNVNYKKVIENDNK